MRINNIQNIQGVMKAYKKDMEKSSSVEKSQFSKDKIEISESSKDFQVAMKAFQNLPDIREDKVNELKEEISKGTYNPSPQDIAKKMMSDSKNILG